MSAEVPVGVLVGSFGIAATVTPLGGEPVVTRGIWLAPLTEDQPSSFSVKRREPKKVFALDRAAVPVLPLKSVIAAAEVDGGPVRTWRVDGFDRIDVDLIRVVVVVADQDA